MFENQVNVYGVKSSEIRTLILEIMDSRDKIAKILDSVELDFYNCREYYQTTDGTLMAKKMDTVASDFHDILSKIDSYVTTLELVMQNYQKSSMDAGNIFTVKNLEENRNDIFEIKTVNVINTSGKWGRKE